MFKLWKLRVQNEIEELKSAHRIEIAEKNAELARMEKDLKKEYEMKQREMVSLLKLESEQKTKQLELDYNRKVEKLQTECERKIAEADVQASKKLLQATEEMTKKHYELLSTELAKLHTEGNTQTKFTQDLALNMLKAIPNPEAKTRVKVLTGQKSKVAARDVEGND